VQPSPAQLANVGLETILLDIVLPQLSDDDKKKGLTPESQEFRNKLAANGVQGALKSKPASFYTCPKTPNFVHDRQHGR